MPGKGRPFQRGYDPRRGKVRGSGGLPHGTDSSSGGTTDSRSTSVGNDLPPLRRPSRMSDGDKVRAALAASVEAEAVPKEQTARILVASPYPVTPEEEERWARQAQRFINPIAARRGYPKITDDHALALGRPVAQVVRKWAPNLESYPEIGLAIQLGPWAAECAAIELGRLRRWREAQAAASSGRQMPGSISATPVSATPADGAKDQQHAAEMVGEGHDPLAGFFATRPFTGAG